MLAPLPPPSLVLSHSSSTALPHLLQAVQRPPSHTSFRVPTQVAHVLHQLRRPLLPRPFPAEGGDTTEDRGRDGPGRGREAGESEGEGEEAGSVGDDYDVLFRVGVGERADDRGAPGEEGGLGLGEGREGERGGKGAVD